MDPYGNPIRFLLEPHGALRILILFNCFLSSPMQLYGNPILFFLCGASSGLLGARWSPMETLVDLSGTVRGPTELHAFWSEPDGALRNSYLFLLEPYGALRSLIRFHIAGDVWGLREPY